MGVTQQPPTTIVEANERVNRAWSAAVAQSSAPIRERRPAVIAAAYQAIVAHLDDRIALINAALTPHLAITDQLKYWALQRARFADAADRKTADDLATWWAKQPARR